MICVVPRDSTTSDSQTFLGTINLRSIEFHTEMLSLMELKVVSLAVFQGLKMALPYMERLQVMFTLMGNGLDTLMVMFMQTATSA